MELLFNALIVITYASLLGAALIGAFYFKKLPQGLKRLFIFLSIRVGIEALSELSNWYHQPNLWLLHYHVILEFATITWIYREVLEGSKSWFYLTVSGILVLIGFRVMSEIHINSKDTWQLISNLFVHLSVIFLSCTYLYHHIIIGSKPVKPYFFWINAGFLCYFSSTLIGDLIFSDFLKQPTEVATQLWMINLAIGIGFYSLSAFNFLKWHKSSNS